MNLIIVASAAIMLNGLEKLVSYRLQSTSPQTMKESNPVARICIHRLGLFPTHLVFFFLSAFVIYLTYTLAWFSLFAELCLWLELVGSAIVFLNNWILKKFHR